MLLETSETMIISASLRLKKTSANEIFVRFIFLEEEEEEEDVNDEERLKNCLLMLMMLLEINHENRPNCSQNTRLD